MRSRQRLLKWNTSRFIQTFGTAHKMSRSMNEGNRSLTDPGYSSGWRKPETFFQQLSHRAKENKLLRQRVIWSGNQILREMTPAWMTLRPGKSSRKAGTNGQPEGSAVTGKTRKPRAAKTDRKTCNASGHNNSNPTPQAASVANGEWELILMNSSHYCFYTFLYHFL